MIDKKAPMRMCTGCGEMFDKRTLVRVVKSPDGEISLDLTGKKSGRGAYVCPSEQCLKKAVKSKALERALEAPVTAETHELLASEIAKRVSSADEQ